jgi:hypothetical protein
VAPKTNTVFERYKFYNKIQGDSENFEQFLTALRMSHLTR